MTDAPFELLEFGSNSLKYYRVQPGSGDVMKTRKFPWRVAHDYFRNDRIDEQGVREVIDTVQHVPAMSTPIRLNVATGVFREIPSRESLATQLKRETGVRLRVISGKREAKLMAQGFEADGAEPVFLVDLGGATTEWAWIQGGLMRGASSLKLGAIRNHLRVNAADSTPEDVIHRHEEYCHRQIDRLPLVSKSRLLATGGTAKAMARICESDVVGVDQLRARIRSVVEHGAPTSLEPARREVLAAGLIVLERVATFCRADAVEYARTSVRDGMAARLLQLSSSYDREDIHATLLVHTEFYG